MRGRSTWLGATVGALALAGVSQAGVVVYQDGDRKIEIGGLIQLEYALVDPDCDGTAPCLVDNSLGTQGETTDRLFFRRLRPYLAGTISKGWDAKIEFDFGEGIDSNEIAVKDAYFAYSGFETGNLHLTIGNAKHGFARGFLTSSSRLQLVERSIAGDHNFGTPDRVLGVRLDGAFADKKVGYRIGVGSEYHDPAAVTMDFDTPANDQDDWNQGLIVSGRVDFHPLGELKYDQADFHSESFKLTVSVGAYAWRNDDDNNTYTDPTTGVALDPDRPDLDSANGLEVSGGVRGRGFSADVEWQRISGDTVDPAFTGGLYLDGTTDLDKLSVNAGYMFPGNHFEIAAGWDSLDADNYADTFDRTTVGFNYYLHKHDLKFMAHYRMVENFLGFTGQDHNVVFAMGQYVF
jgi:phosphate-selective porin OprO and OprP